MNELQIFKNEEFGEIRTVTIDNEPWFVGKDVAGVLGYGNTKDAIANHVDVEDRQVIQRSENATFKIPNRGLTLINESGLYSLIMSSKLSSAKKFKRWVTSEVLPSIRKTGSYSAHKATRPLTTDDYVEAAKIVSKCTPMKLNIVLHLLEKGGFDIPRIENTAKILPKHKCITADSVNGYFDIIEIEGLVGTPTCEVYQDYVDYCTSNDKKPISNIVFSKCVNNAFDTQCRPKRINGTVKRIFILREGCSE